MGAPLASDDEILRATADVLAQPDYAWRNRDDASWAELLARIEAAYQRFADWMEGLAIHSPALYWTVLIGLLVIAIGLLAHVVVSVRAAARRSRPLDEPSRAQPARDRAAEASQLASEGRFLDAARQLHLACLEGMVGSDQLRLGRGDAGRALRAALSDALLPEAERQQVLDASAALERAVFRGDGDEARLFDQWRTLHARLAPRWEGA